MYNATGAEQDITASSGFVLLNIDLEDGTPSTQIAQKMGMEPRSLTRMLKSLEDKGDTYREQDSNDGRIWRVHLTNSGKAKRELARTAVLAFNNLVREEVPADKLKIFFEVADSINHIIDQKSIYDKVNLQDKKVA
jgi:DNA-binding MarR family transcriptional regulator